MPTFVSAFAAFCMLCVSLAAQAGAVPRDDGPHVVHRADGSESFWWCDGRIESRRLAADRRVAQVCGEVGPLTLNAAPPPAYDVLPAAERWAAVSDIHGQYALFRRLLTAHGIIDKQGNWSYGRGVLVIPGDVFDRGPQVNEALWHLYRLEQQAGAAGGAVHLLLGNHEYMVLQGDLRYVHERYQAVAEALGRNVQTLYGADTELGRWLRAKSTILRLGDTVFLHGGLHPDFVRKGIDIAALNRRFRADIDKTREAIKADPDSAWLFGRHGPIWYRGYFLAERAKPEEIDSLLKRLEARRIVVGHTTLDSIRSLYRGRVIAIDAGLKDEHGGELLLHENGRLWRGLSDGGRVELPAGDDDGKLPVEH
ncbi:MAG TPA: metallophosphoesterase [Paucimonas sp.]|nr:metallophosphoesterase [Paucimonas sp.]